MKEQNEKIKNSMSKKCLNRRYKKNAISLKAQSIAFAVESGFNIFLLIFQFKMIGEEFKPYLIFQIGIFTNALSNIALFVASPELRREYFGGDDIWIPKLYKNVPIIF